MVTAPDTEIPAKVVFEARDPSKAYILKAGESKYGAMKRVQVINPANSVSKDFFIPFSLYAFIAISGIKINPKGFISADKAAKIEAK